MLLQHYIDLIMNFQWQALIDTSDREIFTSLICCYSDKYGRGKGVVSTQLIGERAQIILDEVRDLSLLTHMQCLMHIGTLWVQFSSVFRIPWTRRACWHWLWSSKCRKVLPICDGRIWTLWLWSCNVQYFLSVYIDILLMDHASLWPFYIV